LERLTRVEEDVVNVERPQRRILGSVISQFTTINNSMQEMRDLINRDIREKKKYYREETKILQKDSRNLQVLNMSFGRRVAAGALGIYGLSQIQKGNLGEGAAGIGGAAALLSPEILSVITTVVTTKLASSGLLGRGAGVGTIGTRVAGASKLKNPLLITAALAASLILPGLVNSNQNADRRRQMTASRVIRGSETINKPDVDRFRVILARFDSILSSISLERKKEGRGIIDEQVFDEEPDKKKKNEENEIEPNNMDVLTSEVITQESEEKEEKGGFFDGIKNLFNFGKKEEVSQIDPVTDNSIAFADQSVTEGDVNVEGSNFTNMFNNTSSLISMDMIESGISDSATSLLPNMSIEMMSNEIISNTGEGGTSVIDISAPDQTNNSLFSGLAARPTFVSVGTKFDKSVPKFEAAASLRTWGAFT
tara:strand:- start:3048 stop:4319 length:1272 start_codon:yes stop_codon:yes gene_type:complete